MKRIVVKGEAALSVQMINSKLGDQEHNFQVEVLIKISLPEVIVTASGMKESEISKAVKELYGPIPDIIATQIASAELIALTNPEVGNRCNEIFYEHLTSSAEETAQAISQGSSPTDKVSLEKEPLAGYG